MYILSKMGFRTLKKNTRRTLATILAVVFSSLIISLMACIYCLFMYSLNLEKYKQTPIAVFSLIYVFVAICVVAMLYNSFSISITERIPQLGLLSSIGASPKQLYKSLITESLFIGFTGVPIGSVLGVAVFVLLCRGEAEKNVIMSIGNFLRIENISIQKATENLHDILMPDLIAIMAIMIVVIIIAAGFSANRVLKMKTMDALGIGKAVKKKGKPSAEKKIRSVDLEMEQIIKKIFGVGGVIGYKSYRRNKSWHRSLQKPLIICITVFAVVNSVMFMLAGNLKSVERDYNIFLSVHGTMTDDNFDENKQINKYKECESVIREYCEESKVTAIKKVEASYNYPLLYVINGNQPVVRMKKTKRSFVIGDKKCNPKIEFWPDEGTQTLDIPVSIHENISSLSNMFFYIYNENNQKSLQADVQAIADKLYSFYKNQTEIYINKMNLNGSEEHLYSSAIVKGDGITVTITNRDEQYQEAQEIYKGLKFSIQLFSVLILIVTVANIINTVHHNMIIRRRNFAVYRSIGMDKKQKRQMLTFECVWISLLSSLLSVPYVFLGIVTAIVFLSYTAAYKLTGAYNDTFWDRIKVMIRMNVLWENIFSYLTIILIFLLIVFLITTAIADRIIDDGEIIPTLKND